MLTCPCGEPVSTHYDETAILALIEELGEMKTITTPAGTWRVPTIHVLVQGVAASDLPESSFEKVRKEDG